MLYPDIEFLYEGTFPVISTFALNVYMNMENNVQTEFHCSPA